MTQVAVAENATMEQVCFGILQGTLEIPVTVQVAARNGTATCEWV